MIALVLSVLGASLVGSPHCAGMCGGFVCFVAGQDRRLAPQLAYHGGRLAAYAALGALAGTFGLGLQRAGELAGVAHGAAIVAGAVMVLWGGAQLARALGFAPWGAPANAVPPTPPAVPARGRAIVALLRLVRAQSPEVRSLTIGLASGLLPCGFLWAFVAAAASTGHPLLGALAMTAFWAGTLPVLTGLGWLAQRAIAPLSRRLPILAGSALIVIGLLTIAGKFRPIPLVPGAACEKCFPGEHR